MTTRCRCLAQALLTLTILQAGIEQSAAQNAPPSRPFRGLFRNRLGASELGHSLDLQWSVLSSKDDTVTSGASGADGQALQVGGLFYRPAATVAYGFRARRAAFTVSGGGGGRYYSNFTELNAEDATESASFAAELGKSTQIRATQRLASEPYFQIDVFGGMIPMELTAPAGPEVSLLARRSLASAGDIGVTRRLGRRSQVVIEYMYQRQAYSSGDERFQWQNANGKLLHNLTRYAALRLGYGRGESTNTLFAVRNAIRTDTIDVGVDYSRPLSFSRKTTIGFSSGTASVSQSGRRDYQLVLDGRLRRELERHWNLDAAYHRGFQFQPGFADPFFADALQLQVSGLIGRRMEFNGSGGYASGRIGLNQAGNDYSSGSASVAIRFALTRLLSIETGYTYARYDFDLNPRLPAGLPRHVTRQGVRVGLSGWLPLAH